MHLAPLYRFYSVLFWKRKTISGPQASFLRPCITVIARIKTVIGFSPVGGYGAYRIFNHVGSTRPFADEGRFMKQLDTVRQLAQALSFKPARTADGKVGTGWESKNCNVSIQRRKIVGNVNAHSCYIAVNRLPFRMLYVHTQAVVACFCPRFNHGRCFVEKA